MTGGCRLLSCFNSRDVRRGVDPFYVGYFSRFIQFVVRPFISARKHGSTTGPIFLMICVLWCFSLPQALRQEEANESQSMADFLKDLVSMTLTDKVGASRVFTTKKEERSFFFFFSI